MCIIGLYPQQSRALAEGWPQLLCGKYLSATSQVTPWLKLGCGAGSVIAEVQQYIKAQALECEECIFMASGQADAPEEPETTETGKLSVQHTKAGLLVGRICT